MKPGPDHSLASVVQRCTALAFDHRYANKRPVFALTQQLQGLPDGRWLARREWHGVGSERVAAEQVEWQQGLLQSLGELPSIGETTEARCAPGACLTTLRNHRTGSVARERRLVLPHAAVTLGSLPLLIAQHWPRLRRGAPLRASYLVLKVQRAASVCLQRLDDAGAGEIVIAATPSNPVLRWLFGSTRCIFDADAPRLRRIEGLLDPRDLKPSGRWQEYLGRIEFSTPLDLSALVQQAGRP